MTTQKQLGMVSGFLTLSAVLGGLSISAQAATFYVSKASNASDSYTVTDAKDNQSKPFNTIKKALDMANDNPSADVNQIVVEPGTYPESFSIHQNGMTLKARNNANYSSSRSIVKPVGPNIWNVVSIEASNVTLLGFEIDGSQAYVDGTQENGTYGAPTNGVYIPGDHLNWDNTTIPASRNVRVAACVIHDNGGGGVAANGSNELTIDTLTSAPVGGPDYVTIEDNIIYNNCYWSRWDASGISLHNMTSASTSDTNPHNFIRRNNIYGNRSKFTKVDYYGNAHHTDGNGIIIDYNGDLNPPTLIENNLVYLNGGRGIHLFNSSNVKVRNNSTYNNNGDPDISGVNRDGGGELVAINGKNVQFLNNVSYGFAPNFLVESLWGYPAVSNVTIRACTYYGNFGTVPGSGVTDWNTTFHGDPYYNAPDSGNLYPNVAPQQSGKTLAQSQTVIDRASTTAGDYASNDYYLTARPQGARRDRGAIERSLPAQAPFTRSVASG